MKTTVVANGKNNNEVKSANPVTLENKNPQFVAGNPVNKDTAKPQQEAAKIDSAKPEPAKPEVKAEEPKAEQVQPAQPFRKSRKDCAEFGGYFKVYRRNAPQS